MPGYHNTFPNGTADKMAELIKKETDASILKRIQCIYLRAKFNYPAKAIAEIVGLHKQTVLNLHSRYIKLGEASLELKSKGGRIKENMTIEEEKNFLKEFEQDGDDGQILEVSAVRKALIEKLERNVPKSSVYVLLHRHGWRKVAPRPYHPKRNTEKQETFKKTSLNASTMRGWWQKAKD